MIICGDVHGHIQRYINIVKHHDYSLQVGDMGFDYSLLYQLNSENHKFVPGNHEQYDKLPEHALGDYGVWKGIFYIRGGYSIDRHYRTPYIDWWPQEQLSHLQGKQCIEEYKYRLPSLVVSHSCPLFLLRDMFEYDHIISSSTGQLLEILWNIHKPTTWVFGHYHEDKIFEKDGTRFICLAELSTLEI